MEACHQARFWMWCRVLGSDYVGLDQNTKKKRRKAYCKEWGNRTPSDLEPNYEDMMKSLVPQAKATTERLEELKMNLIGSGTKYREDNFSLDCFNGAAPAYKVDTENYKITNCFDCCNQSSPIQEKDLKIMEGLGIYSPKKNTTRNDDMYVSQDVTVTEKNDASQTKSYFLRRIQDVESEKSREAYKTYGFEGLSRSMTPNELIARIKADAFTLETDEADDETYDVLDAFTWTTVKKDRKGYEAFQRGLVDLAASTKDAIWAETDFSKLPGLVAAFKAATVTPVILN